MPFSGRVNRTWWPSPLLRMEMAIPLIVTAMASQDFQVMVSPSRIQPAMAAIGGASVMNSCPKRAPMTR